MVVAHHLVADTKVARIPKKVGQHWLTIFISLYNGRNIPSFLFPLTIRGLGPYLIQCALGPQVSPALK